MALHMARVCKLSGRVLEALRKTSSFRNRQVPYDPVQVLLQIEGPEEFLKVYNDSSPEEQKELSKTLQFFPHERVLMTQAKPFPYWRAWDWLKLYKGITADTALLCILANRIVHVVETKDEMYKILRDCNDCDFRKGILRRSIEKKKPHFLQV